MEPIISVIIPVYNASATLKSCLEAVIAPDNPPCEYIVADDGSTDASQTIAHEFPVQVVAIYDGPAGPAHARNRASEVARGSILFFVDADVVLAPGAIRRVARFFEEQTHAAAVFGSYDTRPKAPGVISQYRNLLHHFVHQHGNSEASTFWAGCGAIRRSVFRELGGFDEKRFSRPCIEDIELGYRLRQAGHRILLDKALHATHLKEWTLSSMIRTDVFCRAMPWSRLILETKKLPNDLNVSLGERVSLALVALCCLSLPVAAVQPGALAGSAMALLGVGVLNRKLYMFFFRQRGMAFAAACIPLHLLFYVYCGVSYSWVWAEFQLKRLPIPRRIVRLKADPGDALPAPVKMISRKEGNIGSSTTNKLFCILALLGMVKRRSRKSDAHPERPPASARTNIHQERPVDRSTSV